jgi:O-antigen/teichoic acid export membrane protein
MTSSMGHKEQPPGEGTPGIADEDATTGASVLAGGAWSTISLLLPQAYTLVISVVAARALGPEGMGEQSFVAFAQISLIVILSSGMQHVLMRFVGDVVGRGRPGDVRLLLRWSWRAQALGALAGGGALGAIAVARPDLRTAWLLAAFACAASVLHAVPASLLRGLQRWREASIMALVTGAVGMVVTVAVLVAGGGIVGMFAVEAVMGAISLAWVQILARRASSGVLRHRHSLGDDNGLRSDVARYAILATLQALLFLVVWRRSEFLFLERYSTASEIAMYSVAFAASSALVQIPQGLASVLAPAIAHLSGAGAIARIRSGFGRAMRLLLLVSLPLAIGAATVGPTAVEVVYGEEYRRAGTVLVVLVIVLPVMPLYCLGTSLLYAVGRVRSMLAVSLLATVVNLILDVALIPSGGALGAAVANVAAQSAAGVLVTVVASRHIHGFDWEARRLVDALLAAVGAGLVASGGLALLGGVPGALASGLASMVVFAVLGLRWRILSPADAEWLDVHAGHIAGGLVSRLCRPFTSSA